MAYHSNDGSRSTLVSGSGSGPLIDLGLVEVMVGVGWVLSMNTSSWLIGEGASGVLGESGILRVGDPGGVVLPRLARLRAVDLRTR